MTLAKDRLAVFLGGTAGLSSFLFGEALSSSESAESLGFPEAVYSLAKLTGKSCLSKFYLVAISVSYLE